MSQASVTADCRTELESILMGCPPSCLRSKVMMRRSQPAAMNAALRRRRTSWQGARSGRWTVRSWYETEPLLESVCVCAEVGRSGRSRAAKQLARLREGAKDLVTIRSPAGVRSLQTSIHRFDENF